MQDRFVGDVGDFGKYGLLNALCLSEKADKGPKLSLGVVWHFVPEGVQIRYLEDTDRNKKDFGDCEQKLKLWEALRAIVEKDKRGRKSVASIEKDGILPSDTVFFSEQVPSNRNQREVWLQKALDATARCDVLFLDPDNGLEPKSKPGRKHVFLKELKGFWRKGQRDLVIYHHLGRKMAGRNMNTGEQIKYHSDRIRSELGSGTKIFTMPYHSGGARVFFIIPTEGHWDLLLARAEHLQKRWRRHFDPPRSCS